jgi:hypothetical protein
MPPWIALALACLLGCSGGGTRGPAEIYEYLVTPAGQRFRVVAAGPILRGGNTKIGLRISYVAQAKTPAELLAHADQLVAAIGPEMQLVGDKTLSVRARLGPPSLVLDPPPGTRYELSYRLTESGFQRETGDRESPRPPSLEDADIPDDPAFPYRAERLHAAAEASASWLALLDDDDLSTAREQMTPSFQHKVADDQKLDELMAQRHRAGIPGTRRELYRMQTRSKQKKRKPGDDALVLYRCTAANGSSTLEKVILTRDANEWRIAGYVFQPIPK